MARRVVVTGIGVVAAPGATRETFWNCLVEGRSAIGPLRAVPEGSLRFPNAAEVPGFDPARLLDPKYADFLDRFSQFALIAAREAVADAEIVFNAANGHRAAVITGSSVGGILSEDQQFRILYQRGESRIHPLTIARTMANAGAACVAQEYGITGPSMNISTACSSSTHAIGQAFWMLRNGVADTAIAGGSEAPLSLGFLKA